MVTSNNVTSSDVTSLLLQVTSTWPMPKSKKFKLESIFDSKSEMFQHIADGQKKKVSFALKIAAFVIKLHSVANEKPTNKNAIR